MTPVAEPLSTEPTPSDGPTSLGPLDLLPSEELLTDTSNSSSSTGEEGEAGGPNHLLQLHMTNLTQTGLNRGFTGSQGGHVKHSLGGVRHLSVFSSALKVAEWGGWEHRHARVQILATVIPSYATCTDYCTLI